MAHAGRGRTCRPTLVYSSQGHARQGNAFSSTGSVKRKFHVRRCGITCWAANGKISTHSSAAANIFWFLPPRNMLLNCSRASEEHASELFMHLRGTCS
eukprot:350413-Chlamydomonas_euryale.AAC.10